MNGQVIAVVLALLLLLAPLVMVTAYALRRGTLPGADMFTQLWTIPLEQWQLRHRLAYSILAAISLAIIIGLGWRERDVPWGWLIIAIPVITVVWAPGRFARRVSAYLLDQIRVVLIMPLILLFGLAMGLLAMFALVGAWEWFSR